MDTWGGNTPINLKPDDSDETKLVLKGNKYSGYIAPTFDLGGSKELESGSPLSIASPLDCLKTNLLSDPYTSSAIVDDGSKYFYPVSTEGTRFSCVMQGTGEDAEGHKEFPKDTAIDFESVYQNGIPTKECTISEVKLDSLSVSKNEDTCQDVLGTDKTLRTTYRYKKIGSFLEHKSPTDEEYGAAIKNLATPSLASDRDRYVDFLSAKGNLKKVVYPNLYRLNLPPGTKIGSISTDSPAPTETGNPKSLEEILRELDSPGETVSPAPAPAPAEADTEAKKKLKELLDLKSAEINAMIDSENPSSLSGKDASLYGLLKTGDYPPAKVDLYATLSSNAKAFATVVNAILWNNISNATEKYAFVLEHSLDIDGNSVAPVSGHKSDYELAYIGGLGDASNLRLKVDPGSKGGLPSDVLDIQNRSNELVNLLSASNVNGTID